MHPGGEMADGAAPADSIIRVFLLEDYEAVRRGIAELLDEEEDLQVVGEASTAGEALCLAPMVAPDVAVLDVRLPDGDGVTVCRELRSQLPGVRCLLLTSLAEEDALLAAIMGGAAGYRLKQIRGVDLVADVRHVAAGGSLLDPQASAGMLERMRSAAESGTGLSPVEATTLELIGDGLTDRELAERLTTTEEAVRGSVRRLLAKLGVQYGPPSVADLRGAR
jgi:two-component system, NarL family, response regulator DevR